METLFSATASIISFLTFQQVLCHFSAAAQLLRRARSDALNAASDSWSFSVAIEAIRDAGFPDAYLAWLASRRFVELRRKVTELDGTQRFLPFDEISLPISADTYVVITMSGVALSEQHCSQLVKPVFDPARGTLNVEGHVVRTFRRPAPSEARILQAFHDANWASHILNPFRGRSDRATTNSRLHAIIGKLNRTQHPQLIRFSTAGGGRSLRWEHLRPRHSTHFFHPGHISDPDLALNEAHLVIGPRTSEVVLRRNCAELPSSKNMLPRNSSAHSNIISPTPTTLSHIAGKSGRIRHTSQSAGSDSDRPGTFAFGVYELDDLIPLYNPDFGTVTVAGHLIIDLHRHAPAEERILYEFQKSGWAPQIPNPFFISTSNIGSVSLRSITPALQSRRTDPKQRTRAIIFKLNSRQSPCLIHFSTADAAQCIRWTYSLVPAP